MKRLSFLFFLMGNMLISNMVSAQTETFYYALPENYFEVTVKVQKETFYKAPLSDYAKEVTGLAATVKENKVQYRIVSITVKEQARADKNRLYKLKITGKETLIDFLNSGLLNLATPTISESCKTSSSWENTAKTDKNEDINRFPIYSANAVMEKYDTTYTYEEMDSVLVQIPHVTRNLIVKPSKQQAEDALEKLEKIRDTRWQLVSGDHDVDFSQLGLMLAELQKMENDYLALFGGTVENEEEEHIFIVYPIQKEAVFSLPLFRFSTADGITSKEVGTLSYTLNFKSLDVQNELVAKTKADTKKQKMDNSGKTIYYAQPQVYTVTLLVNGNPSQEFGQYPIAQLGEVLPLSKKVKHFKLDTLTGGLKFIKF